MAHPTAWASRAPAAPAASLVAWALLLHGAAAVAPPSALAHEANDWLSLVQTTATRHNAASRQGALAASAAAAAARAEARTKRLLRPLLWMAGHHGDQRGGDRNSTTQLLQKTMAAGPLAVNATCNGSGYFIDWGSSGMKVYRVHRIESGAHALAKSDLIPESLEDFKLSNMRAESRPEDVQATLDGLLLSLAGGDASDHPEGAVLATAGMRLSPERADELWNAVGAWADMHPGFFGHCGQGSDNSDCKTLAGSEEAVYELSSALRSGPGRELARSGQPFGFASAGGASMQVGVRGPEVELERCRRDLGSLDAHFDPKRANVTKVNGQPMLVMSFLSIADRSVRICVNNAQEQACDHVVGGLDQMRARFDEFLVERGNSTNPCLSEYTQPRPDKSCSFFESPTCVVDRYGGKISGLPPANGSLSGSARKVECRRSVRSFMDQDLVLGRWARSGSCLALAENASKWALLSSFARETQLGADVEHGWEAFGEVMQAAGSLDFPSAEAAESGEDGVFLSSMLLVHFLEVLGVRPSAEVQGMRAEWADEAMRTRGLARGWALPGHCNGTSSSAPSPRCWAIVLAGVTWLALMRERLSL